MMVAKDNGNGKGHDAEGRGDPKTCSEAKQPLEIPHRVRDEELVRWYPMRVTYGREMKMTGELDRIGIECFVPMTYKMIDADGEGLRRELVPAINNLIFVRSTQERISGLKRSNEVLEPLRYMMDFTAEEEHVILTVPDRQMENFMRVATNTDESVMFLDGKSIVGKEGKRVKIMGGAFEGVEGVIRRVKRCKRVVVEIEGVASVAIAHVPVGLLREI